MRYTLIIWSFFSGFLLISSCIPQKKLLLLQENPTIPSQEQADKPQKSISLQKRVYILKPGDVLSLQVQSTTRPELNFLATPPSTTLASQDPLLNGYTIDEGGNINLPVVGKINLLDMSLAEARVKVAEVLKPYLSDPTVNLRLLTFRFTVLGEVLQQGQFNTFQDDINILEALSYAGGLTPFSDRGNVKLIRKEGGEARIYNINLLDNRILGKQNFYLMPEDMIVVDPLPARNIRENVAQNMTIVLSLITTLSIILTRVVR